MSTLQSLQTAEMAAALAVIGYAIYKYETTPSIGDAISNAWDNHQHDLDVTDNRATLVTGPPSSDWSDDKKSDYTFACRFVLANKTDFSADEILKAQTWIDYITAHPSSSGSAAHINTPQEDTAAIATYVSIIEGPYPTSDDPNEAYRARFTWASLAVYTRPTEYSTEDVARAQAWIYWINYPLTTRPKDSGPSPASRAEARRYDWRANHLDAEPSDQARLDVCVWVRDHSGSVSQEALDASRTWLISYSSSHGSHDPHSGY